MKKIVKSYLFLVFAFCFSYFVLFNDSLFAIDNVDSFSNNLISMIKEHQGENNVNEEGYTSKRLIVESNEEIDCDSAIDFIREDNVYVLQYASEEDARNAYLHYSSLNYVDAVEYDITLEVNSINNGELFYYSWGAEEVGAQDYSEYLMSNIGSNNLKEVVIAVLDTGIDTDHDWFKNRIASGGVNFSISSSSSSYQYEDVHGHGTHASGIITDLTFSNVKILPVKVLNDSGEGNTSLILKGIEYVIEKKKEGMNIVAMNLSLGSDGVSVGSYWHTKFTEAIEEAYNLGILTIAAAGNGVKSGNTYIGIDVSNTLPANVSKSITISAVQQSVSTPLRSTYSNYGKYIDYSAPGTYIDSAGVGGGTIYKSGTSMAAPHVSAVIALLYSDSSVNYSVSAVEKILKENAIDLGEVGFDNYYGNGLINIKNVNIEKIDSVAFSETNSNHNSPFQLELTSNEEGAVIYYTLDGSTPSIDNGYLYNSKINITSSTTVKAIAYVLKNGYIIKCSDISTYSYNFSYTINVIVNGKGSVSPNSGGSYAEQTNQTFNFYPDEGNYIYEVLVDGIKLSNEEIEKIISNGYTFKNIKANHTLNVTYKTYTYNIISSIEGRGNITPLGETILEYGENQKYEFSASEGANIEKIIIDGVELKDNDLLEAIENGYTFSNVKSNHSIVIVFKSITFSLNIYHQGITSGSIFEEIIVEYSNNHKYEFSEYEGYYIESIEIDGNKLLTEDLEGYIKIGYTFNNIKENHIVYVMYKEKSYTITGTSVGMVGITPYGETTIKYKNSQKYEFRVINGYYISEILVDDVSLEQEVLKEAINNGYTFYDVKENHTIVVVAKLITYDIKVEIIGDGYVTPGGTTTYKQGASKTFKFTSNEGNYINEIAIDGVVLSEESINNIMVNGYTFENITSNHEIKVTFKIYTFTIIANSKGFGSITPQGEIALDYGSNQKYQFIASNGYHIDKIIVDEIELNEAELTEAINYGYTFEKIKRNHTIQVIYSINEYSIVSSFEGEGSITPLGETILKYGDSQKYQLLIYEGYCVDKVMIDGRKLTSNEIENMLLNGYIFNDIKDNHTIHVVYKIIVLNITFEIEGNGNVILENNGYVNYGENTKVTIKSGEKYTIKEVYIDNVLVLVKNEYLLEEVKENHYLKVVFVEVFEVEITGQDEGSIKTYDQPSKGEDVTYYFTPNEGYNIKEVFIDGEPCGSLSQYTFYDIDKKHSIEVIYEIKTYVIVIRVYGNGFATSRQNLNKVEYGENIVIDLLPDNKNEVNYVLVNSEKMEPKDNKLTLENITSNIEVLVMFKEKSNAIRNICVISILGLLVIIFISIKIKKSRN